MNPRKQDNILQLDGADRYAYFIRKVADQQTIWGLHQSGWATAADETETTTIAFWPEKEFAELCAVETWSGYLARSIEFGDFIDKWLPGMIRDGVKVAVFPTPSDRGVVVLPLQLKRALEAENLQYD